MNLPPGTIIGEKRITRTEFVGIDDTITDEPNAILFVPADQPTILQIRLKATGQVLTQTTLKEMFAQASPEFLAQLIKELKK